MKKQKSKKRVNWFKVGSLILLIIEFVLVVTANKDLLDTNINYWRLYITMIMFMLFNLSYILNKEVK